MRIHLVGGYMNYLRSAAYSLQPSLTPRPPQSRWFVVLLTFFRTSDRLPTMTSLCQTGSGMVLPVRAGADRKAISYQSAVPSKEWPNARLEHVIGPQHTDCFTVDRLTVTGEFELEYDAPWHLGIVTAGHGCVQAKSRQSVRRGDNFFVSNRVGKLKYLPDGSKPLELYLVSHAAVAKQ